MKIQANRSHINTEPKNINIPLYAKKIFSQKVANLPGSVVVRIGRILMPWPRATYTSQYAKLRMY